MNRKGIAGPLLEYIQNMAHYLRVLHGNDGMQVITLDIGDVLYTTQQLNYIVLKHVNWVHINSSSCLFITEIDYRLGTVNSKSFVSKVLLRIKWKFELTVHFKHEMLGE